jgi:5'-3' exonuclease
MQAPGLSEEIPALVCVPSNFLPRCFVVQIPEFDNFYLDMNGIIHACSHPNDDDPTFQISEDKIFNDIFRYIEVSFMLCTYDLLLYIPRRAISCSSPSQHCSIAVSDNA